MSGALGWSEFRRLQRIGNPLERDWQFKQALGFPEETRTRVASVLLDDAHTRHPSPDGHSNVMDSLRQTCRVSVVCAIGMIAE